MIRREAEGREIVGSGRIGGVVASRKRGRRSAASDPGGERGGIPARNQPGHGEAGCVWAAEFPLVVQLVRLMLSPFVSTHG